MADPPALSCHSHDWSAKNMGNNWFRGGRGSAILLRRVSVTEVRNCLPTNIAV
jgi:hypothetical protein